MTHADLQPFVEEGLVSAKRHATLPLTLYNYSPLAQYTYRTPSEWPAPVRASRGLVLSDDGEIVARPFPKFHNVHEHEPSDLPDEPFDVFEKMDGSLFIVARYGDEIVTATRGSFESEQAERGRQMLLDRPASRLASIEPGETWCFEVLYPSNRIVVDYAGAEKLVLLDVLDNGDGSHLAPHALRVAASNLRVTACKLHVKHTGIALAELLEHERPNAEGYVIRYESGFRVKCKHADYVRLHRILTGMSERTLWEWMRDGQDLTPLLENVPDEFYEWVRERTTALREGYDLALQRAQEECAHYTVEGDRKATALNFTQFAESNASLLFTLLDGKDPAPTLWKMLRPGATKPFFQEA